MRHLYVVVDGSRTMEDQDLKPNRLTCTLKVKENFLHKYFFLFLWVNTNYSYVEVLPDHLENDT